MKWLENLDPRDNLNKARRKELELFAKANGVDVPDGMPAILMRKILREKGLTRIEPQAPRLGMTGGPPSSALEPENGEKVEEVSADDDLMRQWKQYEANDATPPANGTSPFDSMKIYELRRACTERDIPWKRTHKAVELKAMLNGHQNPN